jgi:uncharacterized phage protein (TIGR01671 family)
MREILFRGKRTDNGEWVYGSLVYCPGDNEIGTIVVFEAEDEGDIIFGNHVEVYLNTVGQYTGLTDKNGKKIFEGDNILDDGEDIEVVEFVKGRYYYPFVQSYDYLWVAEDDCVVIGNIHDNPELLENK